MSKSKLPRMTANDFINFLESSVPENYRSYPVALSLSMINGWQCQLSCYLTNIIAEPDMDIIFISNAFSDKEPVLKVHELIDNLKQIQIDNSVKYIAFEIYALDGKGTNNQIVSTYINRETISMLNIPHSHCVVKMKIESLNIDQVQPPRYVLQHKTNNTIFVGHGDKTIVFDSKEEAQYVLDRMTDGFLYSIQPYSQNLKCINYKDTEIKNPNKSEEIK